MFLSLVVLQTSAAFVVVLVISPKQNVHHFADDIIKCSFMNDIFCISIQISRKFVPEGQYVSVGSVYGLALHRR